MAFPEKETDQIVQSLTRRFSAPGELREEVERNVSAGSLWVPLRDDEVRPPVRTLVEVHLVLPDGAVLGLRGRISCMGNGGVAVTLDQFPADLMAILSEEPIPSTTVEPPAPPAPLPPASEPNLASAFATRPASGPVTAASEASPVPRGSGPVTAASDPDQTRPTRTAPTAVPHPFQSVSAVDGIPLSETALTTVPPASVISTARPVAPRFLDPTDPPDFDPGALTPPQGMPAAIPADRLVAPVVAIPAPVPIANPFSRQEPEDPTPTRLSPAAPAPGPAEAQPIQPAPQPVLAAETPPPPPDELSPDPVESAVGYRSLMAEVVEPTLARKAPREEEAEFPAFRRPADLDPVPSLLGGTTSAWSEQDEPSWEVGIAPAKLPDPPQAPGPEMLAGTFATTAHSLSAPASSLPRSATGRFELVMPFATLGEFKREYEANIRKGGVLVPVAAPPPIRSAVEVVFSLMGGKREVRIAGEVVFHAALGAGVQLAVVTPRAKQEIDALLAAASVVVKAEPPRSVIALAPEQASASAPAATPADPVPPPAAAVLAPPRAAGRAAPPPSGDRFEGDLVEVLREAEVEGEARIAGQVGGRASWLKALAVLQAQRASGVLTAERKGETKLFLVYEGRVVDAMGKPPRHDESLFGVVRKLNLLKPGPLRVLEKAMDGAKDEYEAAAAAGIWNAQELDRARRWQVTERTADVFGWDKGRYRFDPDGDRSWARPTSGMLVAHIILHGVRSFIRASGEDLARVMRPALDRVLTVVPGTGFEAGKVGMSDKELRFFADIDGQKTLRMLLSTTPIPVSQTYRVVFALCRLGVLAFAGAPVAKKDDPGDSLRARLEDMKGRADPFGKLGLSWMASPKQIQVAWEAIGKELAEPLKGANGAVAKQILEQCEAAFRVVSDERTRRLTRLKLIEDPSRIESSAEMLAEKADILHLRGDRQGALAAIEQALDLSPNNEHLKKLSAQLAREG